MASFSKSSQNSSMPQLVLASTSVFRRELLARLQLPFETVGPHVDEMPLPGEVPAATAERLAEAKARKVGERYPEALVIGSDQVAFHGDRSYGKPGTRDKAIQQLRELSGKTVTFHTALCLLNTHTGRTRAKAVPTEVRFRALSDLDITRYLDREDALSCAGGAKAEGLGIALLEYQRGDDPNALIGLPLIALCNMLRAEGIRLP